MKTARAATSNPGNPEEDSEIPRPQSAPRGLLNFYALLSIASRPKRGYDLIKEIETKTEGAWRPGPGAVYPVLQKLVKQGYLSAKKRSKEGPIQVLYQITPAGLAHISDAKKTMRTSTERMSLMSSLFVDLMEPDDLVRFVLNSFDLQTQLLRMIVESDRSRLSDQDKLFVLRQYRLNLERELSRGATFLRELEGRTREEAVVSRRGAMERRS
jgi:DNA-binding PadR family transcriptional regulator